jgi:hypothetical protein
MSRPAAHDDVEHVLARQMWRATLLLGFRGGIVHVHGDHPDAFRDTKPRSAGLTTDARTKQPPFAAAIGCATRREARTRTWVVPQLLDRIRPDGVLALAVPSETMDDPAGDQRAAICLHADLVGAIRLPCQAARALALPGPVDVLLLRRRPAGEPARYVDWETTTRVTVDGQPVRVNAYFDAHPDQMLGTTVVCRATTGEPSLAVRAGVDELEQRMAAAIGHIAWDARHRPQQNDRPVLRPVG